MPDLRGQASRIDWITAALEARQSGGHLSRCVQGCPVGFSRQVPAKVTVIST
jgi:hypothetical protein